VSAIVGFTGRITFDANKPDGTPRKLLDTSGAAALGWQPTVGLRDGIAATYAWYCAQ
jgi:GDP-L-fucose synthase